MSEVVVIRKKPHLHSFDPEPREWDSKFKRFIDERFPLRPMAKTQKEFYAKYGGSCNVCAVWSERLFPDIIKVCPKCLNRFLNRGKGKLTIIKREIVHIVLCYWCNNNTNLFYHLNPRLCEKCLRKVGFGRRNIKRSGKN